MARTAPMRLVELMVLKEDIDTVIEFLGKNGNFQFQQKFDTSNSAQNPPAEIFAKLKDARSFLNIADIDSTYLKEQNRANESDTKDAEDFLSLVDDLKKREMQARDELNRITETEKETRSFENLKIPYNEIDHLSFLTIRIGKIDPAVFDDLVFSAGGRAVIIPLGQDKSHIMAATSKKGRFSLDTTLKEFGFVSLDIPEDFKGVPDDVLEGLVKEKERCQKAFDRLEEEKHNLAQTHIQLLQHLLGSFSLSAQIKAMENSLESTELVYRLTGWIPESSCHQMMTDVDRISEGRVAIRVFDPDEVPSVRNGREKVPVKLHHGKIVGAFERMIFSYGSPTYGSIDPTPFVAFFFTLLFGIMFGDAGQGLVFLLAGILMQFNLIKFGGWNKFAPIFMCIGCSSMIMGVLTGEFFATEGLLDGFSMWITGLFGQSRAPILEMKFWDSDNAIGIIFGIFGFTMAVGFVINSIGLIINFVNNINRKKFGKAFFGKTGLSGALFFWYVVFFALSIAFLHHEPCLRDWIIIGLTMFFAAFGEPFERLFDGERPVLENGLGSCLIGGAVELIEVVSTYLSNSISFVRVGAFALAHAVLGFIIAKMTSIAPDAAKVLILIAGNAIVVVLEGMIVAIQVIRLQYYEFFSKFFNETGREFVPFAFEYK